jgi:hypothetical protein
MEEKSLSETELRLVLAWWAFRARLTAGGITLTELNRGRRTPSPVGITMRIRIRIAGCRSATTPIQLRDCHTSMNTPCQSTKLRISSVDRCKTYADVMIPALRSVRLGKDDI